MPIKYNLTKYDVLANKIHKVSLKYGKGLQTNGESISEDDDGIRYMAIIVASLTSSHSWQTHKCIESNVDGFNSESVKGEYLEAAKERWKHVTPSDINELANLNISDSIFYRWLFFNIERGEQENYKRAWRQLKDEIENPAEGVVQGQ